MTEKKGITLFLALVLVFACFFIVVYKPVGNMRATETMDRWNIVSWSGRIYIAIQVFVGFVFLLLSRIVFYLVQKKHNVKVWGCAVWIVSEIVVLSLLLTVVAGLLNEADNLSFEELLQRVFFNIVYVLFVPYLATVLILLFIERGRKIEELRSIINKQSEEKSDGSENINFYALGGKLAFSTKRSNVLYIEAADNYSNIHYINEDKEDTFILHNSMKNLDNPEKYQNLLRCHRGYMVNTDNIKLLRKEKDGLVIELTQGNRPIPVSRTYNERVVDFFAT